MTEQEELREIAGRLAALEVTTDTSGTVVYADGQSVAALGYTITPDPRFDALRGEHGYFREQYIATDQRPAGWWCSACGLTDDQAEEAYCLRTDLGAGVRVAAACGWSVRFDALDDGRWECWMPGFSETFADTPELALFRALDEAVKEGG